jgi:hypothetical protein
MSFATIAGLKSAFTSWLGHSLHSDNYDDFISLFEAAACRRMNVRENTTTATITMSGGVGTLPTNFLTAKSVKWTGSPAIILDYVTPEYLTDLYGDATEGTPRHYTIEGNQIRIGPSSDDSLDLLYAQRTDAVSSTLNWLFTKHPDAYLFGGLCEAEAFGVNDERAALWKARRDEVFDEILRSDFRHRSPMAVRVNGVTP